MMTDNWQDFWWSGITGPSVLVDKVAAALSDNRTAVLRVPSDLPWRHAMRGAIQNAYKEITNFPNTVIDSIDAIDNNPEGLEPGKLILREFAPPEVESGFREKSKVPIQQYIANNRVLKDRVVWIKGLNANNAAPYVSFCAGYKNNDGNNGLFVLEISGDARIPSHGRMRNINFDEFITGFDVLLFNNFVAGAQKNYSEAWKKYAAMLSAVVCGADAEISECLISDMDFKTESVAQKIKLISEDPGFLRRGGDETSNHILRHVRRGNVSELEHRIWAAQVQVLFPIIELERMEIVKKYAFDIESALKAENLLWYGEPVENAMDAELGVLKHMLTQKNDAGMYMLYLPDKEVKERILFLHACRNRLAHMEYCTPEQVLELLGD